jgi:hypothetical protein
MKRLSACDHHSFIPSKAQNFALPPCRVGGPREVDLRVVIDAILYMLSSGCQPRLLPKDFPPISTVQSISISGAISGFGIGSILPS